jgi:hypothetical protein
MYRMLRTPDIGINFQSRANRILLAGGLAFLGGSSLAACGAVQKANSVSAPVEAPPQTVPSTVVKAASKDSPIGIVYTKSVPVEQASVSPPYNTKTIGTETTKVFRNHTAERDYIWNGGQETIITYVCGPYGGVIEETSQKPADIFGGGVFDFKDSQVPICTKIGITRQSILKLTS